MKFQKRLYVSTFLMKNAGFSLVVWICTYKVVAQCKYAAKITKEKSTKNAVKNNEKEINKNRSK